MATSRDMIKTWFERGKADGSTHLIVVCDTFDYEDYPVFVQPGEDAREKSNEFNGKEMQRVMEVYNLAQDMDAQLNQARVFNY